MEVASLNTFRTAPERFFHWFQRLQVKFSTHSQTLLICLAEFERSGHLRTIITPKH